jgi:hypothetical protein
VGTRELGEGEGRSKKAAEQLAAEAAYLSITADDAAEKPEDQPHPDPERSQATPEPSAESVKGARATGPALDSPAKSGNAALPNSGPAPDSSAKPGDEALPNSGPAADLSASSVNAALHDSVPPQPGSADAVDA